MSGMTDAIQKIANDMHAEAEELAGQGGCEEAWATSLVRYADRIEAARLRGEAAQGEQQAVATFVGVENGSRQMLWHTDDVPAGAKLYDRPQPVAPAPVAGDAVARLADELMDLSDVEDCHGNPSARIAFADAAGRLRTALAQDRASQAGAAGVPESAREVIELLLQVAYRADVATDDSEDLGDGAGHNVGDAEFVELCNVIEALEALPDDQPGYVMGPAAKARWALRAILAAAPTPAAEGEVR